MTVFELGLAVGGKGRDRQAAAGDPALQLRQAVLGLRENDRDRLQLRDLHDARGAGSIDDVALIRQPEADPPGEGRPDRGIVELRLRVVDRRLVRSDLRGQLRDLGGLRVQLLPRRVIAFRQRLVAAEVPVRVRDIGLVLLLLGLRLFQRRLVGTRIDLGEQVPLFDDLPFFEVDLHDLPVDAAADKHRVVGLDCAQAHQDDREVAPLGGDRGDRNRRRARLHGRGGMRRRFGRHRLQPGNCGLDRGAEALVAAIGRIGDSERDQRTDEDVPRPRPRGAARLLGGQCVSSVDGA